MMATAGFDEAGRGPILGPMVLCGVSFAREVLPDLKRAGVRDSKQVGPKKREDLAKLIQGLATDIRVVELWPREIDELRTCKNLNEIEAEVFARMIDELQPEVAFIDSPDPRPELFLFRMERYLRSKPKLVVENGADRKYVEVSAASIVAKVTREARIQELHQKYGDFGSGYLTDPKTVSFLKKWLREKGMYPSFARRSWKFSL